MKEGTAQKTARHTQKRRFKDCGRPVWCVRCGEGRGLGRAVRIDYLEGGTNILDGTEGCGAVGKKSVCV